MLTLLLLACTESDPDATGPRWDTADTDTEVQHTGVTDTDTDTHTGTVSTGGTGTTPTGDTGPDLFCDGSGATPKVQVGEGGRTAFAAYSDGDRVDVALGPYGTWGFYLDVLTEGLDTNSPMNAIQRVTLDGETTDYLALLQLQCPTEGPGWVQVHAAFDDDLQNAASRGDLDGEAITVVFTLTDVHRDEDSLEIDLILDGP